MSIFDINFLQTSMTYIHVHFTKGHAISKFARQNSNPKSVQHGQKSINFFFFLSLPDHI